MSPSSTNSPSKPLPEHNPFPDISPRVLSRQYTVRRDPGPNNDDKYLSDLRFASVSGGLGWLLANFPQDDGFMHWPLGFPRDLGYAASKYTTAGTILKTDLMLWHVAKIDASNERVGFRKQGGIACLALFAAPPALDSGGIARALNGLPLPEGTAGGMPPMLAAEMALLEYARDLQDVGTPGSGPMGGAVDGCMAVVFMGCSKSVYYYSKERGFFDLPERFVFEEPGIDAAAVLAASRQGANVKAKFERIGEAEDTAKHDGVIKPAAS